MFLFYVFMFLFFVIVIACNVCLISLQWLVVVFARLVLTLSGSLEWNGAVRCDV